MRKKTRKKSGFSLMEVMVVLLIVSLIAAASAPMINKKLVTAASDKSPWVWANGNSIAYNLNASDAQTAFIGLINRNNVNSRLHIRGSRDISHISFDGAMMDSLGPVTRLSAGINDNIWFSTYNLRGNNNTVIGAGADSLGNNNVVIGKYECYTVGFFFAFNLTFL